MVNKNNGQINIWQPVDITAEHAVDNDLTAHGHGGPREYERQ